MEKVEELAAKLTNRHVEWFDCTPGERVEARARDCVIHFEPRPGYKAQAFLTIEPDGNIQVNRVDAGGRPQETDVALSMVYDALRRRGKRTDQ